MALRLDTKVHIPDIDYMQELMQTVVNAKGIPFSNSILLENYRALISRKEELDETLKKLLIKQPTSPDQRAVKAIDYTGRTMGPASVIFLLDKYLNGYGRHIIIEGNDRIMNNKTALMDLKLFLGDERGVVVDMIMEMKTLLHAVTNANQLMQERNKYYAKGIEKGEYVKGEEPDLFYVYPTISTGKTGRLASSEPAIQSLVDDYKKAMTAREGYKIVSIDISGQESHILIEKVLRNKNIQKYYVELEDSYYPFLKELDLPLTKPYRTLAKVPVLGVTNGMGEWSVSKSLEETIPTGDISREDMQTAAKKLMNLINTDEGYQSQIMAYVNQEKQQVTQYRIGFFGTRYPVNKDRNAVTQLKNGFFQITAAEIVALSLQSMFEEMYQIDKTLDKIRPLITIYDEFVFEVRDDFLEEGIAMIEYYCKPIIDDWTRFRGEVKYGQSYVVE